MPCEQTLMKLSAGLQEISTMFKTGTKGKEIGVSRNFFNVEVKCCFRKNQHCVLGVQDNDIGFWREFVSEYFAPHAKKRWCVSLYGSSGRQPTGVFPQVFFYWMFFTLWYSWKCLQTILVMQWVVGSHCFWVYLQIRVSSLWEICRPMCGNSFQS